MTTKRHVFHLRSDMRTTGTNSAPVFRLDRRVDNPLSLAIDEITVPFSWYVVRENRNQVVFNEGGLDLSAFLSAGTYTAPALVTELLTQMTAAGGNNYVAGSIPTTGPDAGKLTVRTGAPVQTWGWRGANPLFTASLLLGVTTDDVALLQTQLGDQVAQLNYPGELAIVSNSLADLTSGNIYYRSLGGLVKRENILVRLAMGSENVFGQYIEKKVGTSASYNWETSNGSRRTLQDIDFQLVHMYPGVLEEVDLNGVAWGLTLYVEEPSYQP